MLGRIVIALALLLSASPGLAQAGGADEAPPAEAPEGGPSSSQEEEARALFIAGRAAFEHGQLERALEHFLRAYELSSRPGLLFNIGNTHDRLRHDAEAIDYLSRYLEAMPDAPNAEFVRGRLEVLRANLARQEAELEAQREREAASAEERERLLAAATDNTVSDVGIGLMIGGGIGLLVMIGPAVWWAQTSSDLSSCRPSRGCDPLDLNRRQDAAMGVTLSFLVASVLAGGGGALLFAISPRRGDEEEAGASLGCGLAPGGLGCAGRF